MAKEDKKKSNKKRLLALLCSVFIFIVAVLGVLEAGVIYTATSWEQWYADYERKDITTLLEKEELTDGDYELLYRQTGLTRRGIDDTLAKIGGVRRILDVQRAFFSRPTLKTKRFAPFTYMEKLRDERTAFCYLEDGDIIVSAATRVSWWRYGHACVVVNAEQNQIAEAIAVGYDSELVNIATCDRLADFLVLRPKASKQTKSQVVSFIKEELLGIPYRFSVGILSEKNPERLNATQCAHFVWYAYKRFGIDLDSNGGGLVKPQDIALSSEVELVQAFGFDLEKLWK